MSDTVKYSDEKKLLTSDEFIQLAKDNADKNKQIQKNTAQEVYDKTYGALDLQYDEAKAAAGVAKERNLIDADTAYQRQEMKYGAEQEALAAAGLSGSGMNEYRRAQSYQKNREDRQMSYAEYDRAIRDATYKRDQGKLAADITKTQSDAAAEMNYNNAMTGISEKELGYADLERQEADTAYGGYIAGIEDGSLTMDQIRADSSWAKLSPEQQAAVEKTAKIKGIKTMIDNGQSWEDIQTSYAYADLDPEDKRQIDAYHAEVEAGKTKDANAASGNYLEMAMSGMSIDTIKALATQNGHYQALYDSGFWTAISNEATKYANEKAAAESDADKKAAGDALADYIDLAMKGVSIDTIEALAKSYGHYDKLNTSGAWASVTKEATNYADKQKADTNKQTVQDMIDGGASAEEIKGSDAYEGLDDTTKAEVDKIITKNEEQYQANVDSIVESYSDYGSLAEVESALKSEAVPESERGKIISAWQENNVDKAKKGIKDGTLTSETIVQNVKNGMYGDGGASVATEYAKSLLAELNGEGVDIVDVLNVKDDLDNLDGIVSAEWWNRIQTTIASKMTDSTGKVENSGMGYAIEGKKVSRFENLDKSVTDMLEKKHPNVSGMTYVKIGDEYFAYMGNRWKKATMK